MRILTRGALAISLAACVSLVLAATTIAKHGPPHGRLGLQVMGLQPGDRFGIDQVYNSFGCTGKDESPGLRISGVPASAKSLAVTIFDPNAPTQSGWWHWLVYDLPMTTTNLGENASAAGLPQGAKQGPNDFGTIGYGGVCPAQGSPPHHYRVTVWALKIAQLGAPTDSTAALIDYLIEANAITHRTVIVKYSR
jgi:Raf kinase inhibitor-like YbhB/YbcL family protein